MSKAITALWCALAVPTAFALQSTPPSQTSLRPSVQPAPTPETPQRPQGPLAPISGVVARRRGRSEARARRRSGAGRACCRPRRLDPAADAGDHAVHAERRRGSLVRQRRSLLRRLRGGKYYPPSDEQVDPLFYANALPSYADGRPEALTYGFAMFQQRITSDRIARLEALGVRVLGFHPHYSMKVAVPTSAIDDVASDPSIRWLGVPRTWQKIHPALTQAIAVTDPNKPIDVWIDLFDSDLCAQSQHVMDSGAVSADPSGAAKAGEPQPLKYVWVSNGWMQHQLESLGVEVLDYSERIQAHRCRILPAALESVAALDFVQFIELNAPKQPMHDESMPMINADDVRLFYDGNTNSRAVGGIVGHRRRERAHRSRPHLGRRLERFGRRRHRVRRRLRPTARTSRARSWATEARMPARRARLPTSDGEAPAASSSCACSRAAPAVGERRDQLVAHELELQRRHEHHARAARDEQLVGHRRQSGLALDRQRSRSARL
jgi:hypothetical protein